MATSHSEPEKAINQVNVNVSEQTSEKCDAESCEHIQWETGFWKRFPWIGAGALFVMLCSIGSVAAVLATSNGKYREEWPVKEGWYPSGVNNTWKRRAQIQPSVLLALVVNTVTNLALGIAIANGVAISWWRRAMKGSTIADLHKSWGFASSVLELLTAGKRFNYIALAALMAKLALVDNVLLQQSTSTNVGWFLQQGLTVRLPMMTALPADYTGIVTGQNDSSPILATSEAFSYDMYEFRNSTVIYPSMYWERKSTLKDEFGDLLDVYNYDTHCLGVCRPTFEGFGFHWQCEPRDTSADYDITADAAYRNSRAYQQSEAGFNDTQAMSAPLKMNPLLAVTARFIPRGTAFGSVDWYDNDSYMNGTALAAKTLNVSAIGVQVKWTEMDTTKEGTDNEPAVCAATTYHRFCTLTPSTVNYTLEIRNVTKVDKNTPAASGENGITLISNFRTNFSAPEWMDRDFNEPVYNQFSGYKVVRPAYQPYEDKYDNNLRQIANWMQQNYGAYASMEYANTTEFKGYVTNTQAAQDMYEESHSLFADYWLAFDSSQHCLLNVEDPTGYMGVEINNLMVRASMRAATQFHYNEDRYGVVNPDAVQTFEQPQWIRSLSYDSDWRFGAAAMVIIFFCFACVLPSYYGFWQLGRKVTLGPIEVAGAFQAPVMADHPAVATHGEVDQFIKEIGDRPVRYGQVEGQQRLGVAPPAEVVRPGR